MDKDDVAGVLNTLIETSKDGEYGFRTCAERAQSPQLKAFFERRAQECGTGAAELQTLVLRYGEKPEDSGTAAGALHRGWVSVKEKLSGTSDLAVLEECERGEDSALAKYRKAMNAPGLPEDVRSVIARQLMGVQKNHDEVKALRDAAKRVSA